MKYKDKDGYVFEDINEVGRIYCRAHTCCGRVRSKYMCPMHKAYKAAGYSNCVSWQNDHPAEAARLMGYEVVEENPEDCDETPDTCFYWGLSDCMSICKEKSVFEPKPKKEDNMDNQKPRICEVLGVEVGERFTYKADDTGEVDLEVFPDGNVQFTFGAGNGYRPIGQVWVLINAINHPERVIRKPRAEEKEEPMKQDKPLADWTLGELKAWCYQYRCAHKAPCEAHCDIYKRGICIKDWAHEWDLEPEPRFTEEEVAAARVLLAGGIEEVECGDYSDGDLQAYSRQSENDLYSSRRRWTIPHELFPSLAQNTRVKLAEIVGGAE